MKRRVDNTFYGTDIREKSFFIRPFFFSCGGVV